MARHVHAETGERALCLAGGVALNCVANGRLLARGAVRRRSGSSPPRATRAARSAPRSPPDLRMGGRDRHGPSPRTRCTARPSAPRGQRRPDPAPRSTPTALPVRRPSPRRRPRRAHQAALLAEGATVGWFQGRAEFGPARPRRTAPSWPTRATRGRPAPREPPDQVPRELPAVRAVGAGRARGRVLFDLGGDGEGRDEGENPCTGPSPSRPSLLAVHAARRPRPRRPGRAAKAWSGSTTSRAPCRR